MPIDGHLPQADPFSLVPTFKVWINPNSAIALSFKACSKKSNFLHRLDAFATKIQTLKKPGYT